MKDKDILNNVTDKHSDKQSITEANLEKIAKFFASKDEIAAMFKDFIFNEIEFASRAKVVWDFKGHFVACNDAFADIFQVDKKDFAGHSFFSKEPKTGCIHPLDVDRSAKVYNNNIIKGVAVMENFYNRYYGPDLEIIWLLWHRGWNSIKLGVGAGEVSVISDDLAQKLINEGVIKLD